MSIGQYRRLVLELGQGAADPAAIQEAAGFARLLGIDLLALFVEDEALMHASALPFTREISPVTYRWRTLEPAQLESEFRAAAERARQHLVTTARAMGVHQTFEIRRGDPALHVIETCAATDIVVVPPARQAETEAMHGARRVRETAHISAASVLWLPPGVAPRHGPVAVVAAGLDDPCLIEAARLAELMKERLLVVTPELAIRDLDRNGGEGQPEKHPDRPGIRPLRGATPPDLDAAMDGVQERLIVMSRPGPLGEFGAAIATRRGVPVLVVE